MNRAAHATLASASCTCVLSIAVNARPNVQHWLAQYRVKVKFSFFPRILTWKSTSHTVSICITQHLASFMRSCMTTLVIDVDINGQNFCTPPRDLLKKVRAEISASRPRRVKFDQNLTMVARMSRVATQLRVQGIECPAMHILTA